MEGYARHSRSHFKSAPQPPSSAAAYHKKAFANGAGNGKGNGFMAYDDVFGGPPKFGATPFAPRAEDYSEIFGGFRSSRSSSIPMLDLPPVDDSVAAFEVLGCGGLEYSDIFAGFGFADFAASYDELFRRSDGSEDSSDEAWTPVGTESPSGGSDPYASSGRNQYFLNGDFHETLDEKVDKVFDLSYDNANLGTVEDSEMSHEAQLSSAPGYTYVFEGSAMRKEDEKRYSSGVADDIILCEDSSGNVSVEAPWKTASSNSHNCVVEESHDYDEKAGEAHGIGLSPNFASHNGVSLRGEPSNLSSASGLPPTIVDRKKIPASGSPPTKSNTTETIFGGGLFDFFDVEMNTDAGSSSMASAEAIKEAMDNAKLKINSAKELMKRKKDGVNNELNTDGKVRMVFDESVSRDDELHSAHEREFDAVKISGDNMQFVSEASWVLPDPLQPEDAVRRVPEPGQSQSSSLDPGLAEGEGEWKVTEECYELVNNGNSETESSVPDSIKKPGQEMNSCQLGNSNEKTTHAQKLEQNVEKIDPPMKDDKDSESADEACNPRENRRRLRASKPASRNAFHQKMVKLAQDVHETVIGGHVETVQKGKEGLEGDGVTWQNNERKFDQAALHKEESYFAGSEISSEEDFVQADCNDEGKEDHSLKENERREAESTVREETLKRVEELTEREDNSRGLGDAHQKIEEKEEACALTQVEAMTKMLSSRDDNLRGLNEAIEKKDSDVGSKKADEESNVRENEILEKEVQRTHQCEENAAMLKCNGKKLKESVGPENFEKHDVATANISEVSINAAADHPTMRKRSERSDGTHKIEDEVDTCEMEEPLQTIEAEKSQKIRECSAMNEEQKVEREGDLQLEIKITDQDSIQERNLHIESEVFGSSTLNEVESVMACEHEERESSKLSSSPADEDISDLAWESEENHENHAAEDMPISEEKGDFRSGTLFGQMESKVADMTGQPILSERNESAQKQYLASNINRSVGKEAKDANRNLAAEDRGMDEKLKRKEESERERLRELQLEKERERERELEKERLKKLEEERLKERENELEKLRVRRVKELREREKEKELEKERLRKLEEERQREREKDLEKERLRKLEEEWEREREREKDRMGVELKMSADRERAAVERATAEARQRAMAEARERLEKACAEAREKNSLGKASKESQLRAERAAVERATAEARERALEKARAERGVERSVSEKFSSSFRNVELRHCQSSNDLWTPDKSDGVQGESAQRCRARLERHRRTVERVAKALAEKNMRDLVVQREQAERNRFAETLDADIKRWSNGKEGNLRALLSTLQYILGSDSGWQPIPLTEVITSAAVKKAYRKATLCVHPDKLQQRGATIQQKYICEKVFDLLKDAWNRFNSEER